MHHIVLVADMVRLDVRCV